MKVKDQPVSEESIKALLDQIVGKAVAPAVEKALAEMIAKSAKDAGEPTAARLIEKLMGGPTVKAEKTKKQKGCEAARFMRTLAFSRKNGVGLVEAAKRLKSGDTVIKALEAYDPSKGGFMIPEPVSDEIIEILRDRTVVMEAGPRVINMPYGNQSFTLQTASAIAFYVGDCAPVAPSTPLFGRLKLVAKKLRALVPICNDFLRFTDDSADAFVRDDVVQVMSNRMDLAFLRGSGAQDQPKGLRFLASTAVDRTLDSGNSTIDTINKDLNAAKGRLLNAKIPMIKPTWFMSPRTFVFLSALQNALGIERYPTLQDAEPKLLGYPVKWTTAIPDNLGGPGDESEIILADMDQIVVGIATELELSSSQDASYTEVNGTQRHGMQEDFTLIAATSEHDILDRRSGASITVITAIDWY